jgi:hypothetical protein
MGITFSGFQAEGQALWMRTLLGWTIKACFAYPVIIVP